MINLSPSDAEIALNNLSLEAEIGADLLEQRSIDAIKFAAALLTDLIVKQID